jgi:tryptophan synthase alpha chain
MSRIEAKFADLKRDGRRALIPFITAGDPDLQTTELLLHELARAGADLIEVGVPFSDPVADGPVIQRASERALRNGATLPALLDCLSATQRQLEIPIVLFSYFNPLLQFGLKRLASEARAAGVDGILVTDLIPEEADDWEKLLRANAIDPIFLVAPTTSDERLQQIAARARGFLYAISRTGVTGAREEMEGAAEELVLRVRRCTDLPVAVGFGITTARHVRDVWRYADGAVVGSAIVQEIERCAGSNQAVQRVGEFVRGLLRPENHGA